MRQARMEIAAGIEQRTLVLTRLLDAPRELVFGAWVRPEHLVRWFGPEGFTLPHCERDFRAGAHYGFCMHAPDGSAHRVHGEYTHVRPPGRLVFTWLIEDADGGVWCDTVVALTFQERGPSTLLTLEQTTFAAEDHCNEHRDRWCQGLDRLAKHLVLSPTPC